MVEVEVEGFGCKGFYRDVEKTGDTWRHGDIKTQPFSQLLDGKSSVAKLQLAFKTNPGMVAGRMAACWCNILPMRQPMCP